MSESQRTIADLIDLVPWGRLAHAYDIALDAPERLRALAVDVERREQRSRESFDSWLFSAIIHQGTPYSATAPVLWIARRILDADPDHPAMQSMLSAVAECATALRWLSEIESKVSDHSIPNGDAGEASEVRDRNPAGDPLWATYFSASHPLVRKKNDKFTDDYFVAMAADPFTLTACIADWELTILRCLESNLYPGAATDAAAEMARLEQFAVSMTGALRSIVDSNANLSQRATSAFAIAASDAAASEVDSLLQHHERGVRVATALGRPDHPEALEVLSAVVADPDWLQASFPRGFSGPEPWLLPAVLQTVLDRTPPDTASESLIAGLESQLNTREYGPLGASYEWGPVLAWLFHDNWQQTSHTSSPEPIALTDTQRRLLKALVANNDPWNNGYGNASLALGRVGLPHDRQKVAAIAGISAPGRRWSLRRGR